MAHLLATGKQRQRPEHTQVIEFAISQKRLTQMTQFACMELDSANMYCVYVGIPQATSLHASTLRLKPPNESRFFFCVLGFLGTKHSPAAAVPVCGITL